MATFKVKLGVLVAAGTGTREKPSALQHLLGVTGLSAKVNYRLAKLCKAIESELAAYDAARQKACQANGTINASTGVYDIDPAKREDWVKGLTGLLETEVELPGELIEIPAETGGLTPGDLLLLDGIVTVAGEQPALVLHKE